MRFEVRPLGPWTDPPTEDRRSSRRFRASWQNTLDLLAAETAQLGAVLVVLQVDVTEGDIRRDGMLRANSRVGFPGVRVSFESRHGPLTYATDAYDRVYSGDPPGWQANIRALALALEALRAVDRYGVSKRGEQYTGWRAIEPPRRTGPTMTVEQAATFVAAHAPGHDASRIVAERAHRQAAYRAAAAHLHPDRGGHHDQMAQLNLAKQILDTGAA